MLLRVRLILVFREMICSMRSTTTLVLLRCVRSFIFRLHLQNSFESYNSTQNVNTVSLGPGSDWCDQAAGRPLPLHWQVEGKQIGTHCSTIFLFLSGLGKIDCDRKRNLNIIDNSRENIWLGDYYLAICNFSSSFHTDNYPGCHLGLELRWFCNGFSPRCGCRPEQHLQGFNFRFQHFYEFFSFSAALVSLQSLTGSTMTPSTLRGG